MKIQKKRSKKRLVIISLVVVILLAAGGAAWYFTYGQKDNSSKANETSSKKVEKEKTKTSKDKTTSATEDPADQENTEDTPTTQAVDEGKENPTNTDPQAPTTPSSNGKSKVGVVTSSDVSGGTVYIRGGINNAAGANSSCYAELRGPSGTIRKDTDVLPSAASSDCRTIQVPVSELSTGTWTYTLHYVSDSQEGVSNENTFKI